MTTAELRAWQAHMGLTQRQAAALLGMSTSGYCKLVYGECMPDRRMALACAALSAGLDPWGADTTPPTAPRRVKPLPKPRAAVRQQTWFSVAL